MIGPKGLVEDVLVEAGRRYETPGEDGEWNYPSYVKACELFAQMYGHTPGGGEKDE